MRVVYQGRPGAFGEQAALLVDRADAGALISVPSFAEVIDVVAAGQADRGVLPVENSIAGPVQPVVELLDELPAPVLVVDHVVVDVVHLLLGVPGAELDEVRLVRSHPQALAQCRAWLSARGLQTEEAPNTAVAAAEVASAGDRSEAALASRRAAELYGLEVLADEVMDRADNRTRFAVVRASGAL